MAEFHEDVTQTVGLPPGTPVYVGDKKDGKIRITVFDYDEAHYEEREVASVEQCFGFRDKPTVTWINIDGISDVKLIEAVNSHFGIHSLVLEDILNTSQRPKVDNYQDYLFIVLKMVYIDEKTSNITYEHVSLLLGKNCVISFQEQVGDVFNVIRERIRSGQGRVRKMGADYLAYALMDAIIDFYFIILERIEDRIEALEERLIWEATPELSQDILDLKRDLIFLRKQIWPVREVVNSLQKSESSLIKKPTVVFMRDAYDHVVQIIDTVEIFRDILSSVHDVLLSSISYKMNEIMKVLTIFAALFIPLTLISGIYGMNFKYMPGLDWPHGFFAVISLMGIIAFYMLLYFKRKNWL